MKYYTPTYLEDSYKRCYVYDTRLIRFIINYMNTGYELEIAYKQQEQYQAIMFNSLTDAVSFMYSYEFAINYPTLAHIVNLSYKN